MCDFFKIKEIKNRFRFEQHTIYSFGENIKSGIRSREVPVWRELISIVLSAINSGPKNYYGIDRIPVCTGSGMYSLHCISSNQLTTMQHRNVLSARTVGTNCVMIYCYTIPINRKRFYFEQ